MLYSGFNLFNLISCGVFERFNSFSIGRFSHLDYSNSRKHGGGLVRLFSVCIFENLIFAKAKFDDCFICGNDSCLDFILFHSCNVHTLIQDFLDYLLVSSCLLKLDFISFFELFSI